MVIYAFPRIMGQEKYLNFQNEVFCHLAAGYGTRMDSKRPMRQRYEVSPKNWMKVNHG